MSALDRTAVSSVQGDVSGRSDLRLRQVPRAARAGLRLRRRSTLTRETIERGRKTCGAIASCCRSPASRAPGFNSGFTPLVRCDRLAERLGVSELYIKDDSVNHPTLSYKDRVVSVAATRAVELGFEVLACASTGNLANSVAAHAARLGIECCVFIPDNLEAGKLLGSAIFNPTILAIAGNYDDVNRLCTQVADRYGWGFVNINLRVVLRRRREDDGVRDRRAARLALSEASRLAGRGRHAAAAHRARAARAARDRPRRRRAAARATRRRRPAARRSCTRIEAGLDYPEPVRPDTIAKSIAIGNPADGYQVIQSVRATGGTGAAVTDDADRRRDSAAGRDRRDLHRAGRRHDARRDHRSRQARRHPARRIDCGLRDRQRLQDRGGGGRNADGAGAPEPRVQGFRGVAGRSRGEALGLNGQAACTRLARRVRERVRASSTIGSLNSIVRPSRSTFTVAVDPIFASATSRENCDGSSIGWPLNADDDVARPQPGVVGLRDRASCATPARRCVLAAPTSSASCGVSFSIADVADRSAPHLAVLHQVVDDAARQVARHGEADALIAAALAEDAGVDADQLAAAC